MWNRIGRTAGVLGALAGAFALGPVGLGAQRPEPSDALEAWKAELASRADGVWITSNADYAEEDGGTEAYGMATRLQPGGVAATACLWGERDGEVTVFWRFFEGWDPVRGAGLVYQSHPAGLIAVGYVEDRGPGEPGLVQDLWSPDGTVVRTGHFETLDGPDRRISRSVNLVDGEWQPRRSYTWVRDRSRPNPC